MYSLFDTETIMTQDVICFLVRKEADNIFVNTSEYSIGNLFFLPYIRLKQIHTSHSFINVISIDRPKNSTQHMSVSNFLSRMLTL